MEGDGRDENIVCRLFIRNKCFRGNACSYTHPDYNIGPDSPILKWLAFCPDFQRGKCFDQDCRYFHITPEEEENFKGRQEIAPPLLEQAMRKGLLYDIPLTGTRPTCKKFLQGGCSLPMCPCRHITREEFINEVLNTLRCELEIVLGSTDSGLQGMPDFPNRDGNSGNNMQGMDAMMDPSMLGDRNSMMDPSMSGGRNTMMDPSMSMNRNSMMDPPMLGNRNNMGDPVDERQRLERENEAMHRVLDPNQNANSLDEFRANMLAVQNALQWKEDFDSKRRGFGDESVRPGMGNFGRNDYGFGEPSIDLMRRRDPMPPQGFDRNEGFQRYPGMSRNDNDNPPRDRGRGDNFGGGQEGKIFVGGLASVTDTESLKNYFEQFGDLVDAVVMMKQNKPRGFGFVTYAHPAIAENVLRNGPHRVDGKVVDCKSACANPADSNRPRSPRRRDRDRDRNTGDEQGTRLFIGGLKREITTEVLDDYFSQFGKIVDVVSMVDSKTGRPKGYGFVEYRDTDAANRVLDGKPHQIFGTTVAVERPNPRDKRRSDPPPRDRDRDRDRERDRDRDSRDSRSRNNGKSSARLFVGGLTEEMTTDDLKDYFGRFGDVVDCILITEPRTGRRRGFGFVEFENEEISEQVLSGGPHKIYGVRLSVEVPSPRLKN